MHVRLKRTILSSLLALAASPVMAEELWRSPAIPPPPRSTESPAPVVRPAEEIQPAMSLAEVIQIAEANSPNLREAGAQVQVARGKAWQAGLYPNPTLAYGNPQLNGVSSQYNVLFSQEIVTSNKLGLSQAAAMRGVDQAQLGYVRTRFELLTEVRRRFYTAAVAQARLEVFTDLVELSLRSRDIGERLVKAGEGTRTDAIVLDIDLDRAQVQLENARALLDAAKAELAATVGMRELVIPRLAADIGAPLPTFDPEALRQTVLMQNAQTRIAGLQVQRARLELARAEAEPCPNLNLTGGYQYSVPDVERDQGVLQVNMSVPLWNRNQGAIRAAQGDVGTATAQLRRIENELSQQTAAALGSYRAASQQVARYEQQILPKARETLRIGQEAFALGQIDFLRLLQAQRTLVEANLAYVNAQENRWSSAATLAGLLQSEQFP
jgi:cobalt-zinc-cadmium efflux system outer membrane protein